MAIGVVSSHLAILQNLVEIVARKPAMKKFELHPFVTAECVWSDETISYCSKSMGTSGRRKKCFYMLSVLPVQRD